MLPPFASNGKVMSTWRFIDWSCSKSKIITEQQSDNYLSQIDCSVVYKGEGLAERSVLKDAINNSKLKPINGFILNTEAASNTTQILFSFNIPSIKNKLSDRYTRNDGVRFLSKLESRLSLTKMKFGYTDIGELKYPAGMILEGIRKLKGAPSGQFTFILNSTISDLAGADISFPSTFLLDSLNGTNLSVELKGHALYEQKQEIQ